MTFRRVEADFGGDSGSPSRFFHGINGGTNPFGLSRSDGSGREFGDRTDLDYEYDEERSMSQ